MIVSADHVKGKSLEVLAVKDAEVGAFVQRRGSTSVVAKIRTEKKKISRREYIRCHKNPKITRKSQKKYLNSISCQKSKERV